MQRLRVKKESIVLENNKARNILEPENKLISLAIPTYRRNEILVATITQLLSLPHKPNEILILDQTEKHTEPVLRTLNNFHDNGDIVWVQLSTPSITYAMNAALRRAKGEIILFLDDDIEITSDIVREHVIGHQTSKATVVVGKVVQPWHTPQYPDNKKSCECVTVNSEEFLWDEPRYVDSAMAGNMSVVKKQAIQYGGFDENFVRVAYRFEDEFVQRVKYLGGSVYYHSAASIRHLKVPEGGTRAFGNHLTTIKPHHSVGAYYYYFSAPLVRHRFLSIFKRLTKSIATRFHLKNPWWIPVTIISEISGMIFAILLYLRGPHRIDKHEYKS